MEEGILIIRQRYAFFWSYVGSREFTTLDMLYERTRVWYATTPNYISFFFLNFHRPFGNIYLDIG